MIYLPDMKPRIVVFMGGQEEHSNTSSQSGSWLCQYIPRNLYDVTPVEVTAHGQWKVPLGNLPRSGNIARTLEMLSQATTPQDPKRGLERLMDRPVDSIVTLLRGRGGDDGSMHALGTMLHIPVAGSDEKSSAVAFHKHRFHHAIGHIAPTPYTQLIDHREDLETIAEDVWSEFVPPFFVKPVHGANSHNVVKVVAYKDLHDAIMQAKQHQYDLIAQEFVPGMELSVTLYKDKNNHLHTLPASIITPKQSSFYDYHGKQTSEGAGFHLASKENVSLAEQAEAIAQEVYESLRCDGIATVDMVAHDGAIDVLELNTIPNFHSGSPIHHQLRQANIHPENFLGGILPL